MVDFEFNIFDVKKVDEENSLLTLDMSMNMIWQDTRVACRDKERGKLV